MVYKDRFLELTLGFSVGVRINIDVNGSGNRKASSRYCWAEGGLYVEAKHEILEKETKYLLTDKSLKI